MGAKPVEGAGADAGDAAVKNFMRVFRQLEPVDFAPVWSIEDAHVDPGRMGGEDRKIGAVGVDRGAPHG